ncbi:hypothetical protein B0H12DRAFT_1241362 [Mycena haematopus]|nr:hypothetical protein B0H12DRAFT_1241362 [Mycena haematopus]
MNDTQGRHRRPQPADASSSDSDDVASRPAPQWQSQTFNFHQSISGGIGGKGGEGKVRGGSGGAGEGPTVINRIKAKQSHVHYGESGLFTLHDAAASDAFHDSAERYPQPRCHPETRTKMLGELMAWASSNTESNDRVRWLHGPAGAGKSAIAQTLCQRLKEQDHLGASFFFKRRHPSRGDGNKLFPTLAYQLALCLPELKTAISQAVEDDPAVTSRVLETQLRKLIVEPARQSIDDRIFVVVVDGLDECEGPTIQNLTATRCGHARGIPSSPHIRRQ